MLKEITRPEMLKGWNDYTNQTKTARAFARDLLPLLRFREGTQPRTPSAFFDCFAFTSSSSVAALFWCNGGATMKNAPALRFWYIAITTDGAPVAAFLEYDENGDEIGERFYIKDKKQTAQPFRAYINTQPATPADVAALLHDVQTGRAHIREQKHTPRGLYVYTV